MTLKTVVDSTEGLDPVIAAEYVKGDDGKFYLDHTDRDSIANLSRARDHEKTNHGATKTKLQAAEARAAELDSQIEELRANGMTKDTKTEVDRLTKLHTKALETVQTELKTLKTGIETNLRETTAKSLSKDLTGSQEVLAPHIQGRLAVTYDNGLPALQVLDKEGQPTSSLEALKREFTENPEFSGFIKGSQANGGGARPPAGGGGGGGGAGAYNPNATPAERAAWHAANGKISTE